MSATPLYAIRANPGLPGFLQHFVRSVIPDVVTDMTTVCALNQTPNVTPAATGNFGPVQPSSAAGNKAFLRFHNTGGAPGTVTVTLRNASTGLFLADWTSPSIAAGAAPQFGIAAIETGSGEVFTKPSYYSVEIQSQFAGYAQHLSVNPANNTITNLTSCSAAITADPTKMTGVHSSRLSTNNPGTVTVHNTGATQITVPLDIFDAATGIQVGSYTTASIASKALVTISASAIESGAGIVPTAAQTHWVIKAQTPFSGFLQHVVNNAQSGATADMTATCAMAVAPTPVAANYYVAPDGNDGWTGTLATPNAANTDGPFATFARAQTAVAVLPKTAPPDIVVQLRTGTYHQPTSIVLQAPADTGTSTTRIVYRNYPGESPVISGGKRIQGWTNVAGTNRWEATLDVGTVNFESLF